MQRLAKYLYIALGFIFVSLGSLGALLPVLPTVPFMILALWCFARSSDCFHDWLYHHRIFGPQLQLWDKYKVVPISAKILSITSMALSFAYIVFYKDLSVYVIVITAVIMAYAAYYILTKPSFPPSD